MAKASETTRRGWPDKGTKKTASAVALAVLESSVEKYSYERNVYDIDTAVPGALSVICQEHQFQVAKLKSYEAFIVAFKGCIGITASITGPFPNV